MIMATMKNKEPNNQLWYQSFQQRLLYLRSGRVTALASVATALFIITMNILNNNNVYFEKKKFPSLSAQDTIQEHRRVLAIQQEVQAQLLATVETEEKTSSLERPHLMFGDLKYRRVCADVYQSTLCMTIRFPFSVPVQVESVPFPFPVEPKFYQISQPSLFIDGPYLEACHRLNQNNNKDIPINHRVHFCLENVASQHPNQTLVVFTRRRQHSNDKFEGKESEHEDFYGTMSEGQQNRLYEFFDDQDVVVLGDSLSPYVVKALHELFNNNADDSDKTVDRPHLCSPSRQFKVGPQHPVLQHTCRQNQYAAATAVERRSLITTPDTVTTHRDVLSEHKERYTNEILLTNFWFMPRVYNSDHGHQWHVVNGTKPLLDEIHSNIRLLRPRGINQQRATSADTGQVTDEKTTSDNGSSNKLRKISILVELPFAHIQTQYMIYESFGQIEHNQERMAELIINATTQVAKIDWAKLGFELDHLIVFDGFPQHFPSFTSGYVQFPHMFENDFINGSGYPGWFPELGSTCRGPLPPTSALTRVNQLERHHFKRKGFDIKRWYGKTWEFTNQFWWELIMWGTLGRLDCTHYKGYPVSAAPRVLKYFLQAMVDDYFAERKQQR